MDISMFGLGTPPFPLAWTNETRHFIADVIAFHIQTVHPVARWMISPLKRSLQGLLSTATSLDTTGDFPMALNLISRQPRLGSSYLYVSSVELECFSSSRYFFSSKARTILLRLASAGLSDQRLYLQHARNASHQDDDWSLLG